VISRCNQNPGKITDIIQIGFGQEVDEKKDVCVPASGNNPGTGRHKTGNKPPGKTRGAETGCYVFFGFILLG